MTFKEFKVELSAMLYNDVALPEDDVLITIVMQEILNISHRSTPLRLLTQLRKDVVRDLGDGWYIRKSTKILDENSVVDLDRDLIVALVYLVAARVTINHRQKFASQALQSIADFNFKILEARENERLV